MNPISYSQLQTASISYNYQKILLDGTERNFHEAILKINPSAIIPDSYDSDDDFSKFQEEGYKAYIWRDDNPLPACRTTITCQDGNVKGNVLLTICRLFVRDWFNYLYQQPNPGLINKLPGKYFASCAGKFAKFKTTLDCNQTFSPGEYEFGISRVRTLLTERERLFIIDEELKSWITNDLGLNVTRWDLPYRGYNDVIGIDGILNAIKEKVISYTEAQGPRKVPDNQLGTIQLYCAFPESYPIAEPYQKILKQGALHKFLDFFNALIFGLEASRNNLVFLTGLLVLLDMRHGSYPSADGEQKGTVFYDDLLDLFPMSVTGTGAGNFVAEKAMYVATQQLEVNRDKLAGQRALGFSTFRKNTKKLKVTLKSVIVIYNWLASHEIVCYASKNPIRPPAETTPILDTDEESEEFTDEESEELSDSFFCKLNEYLEEFWFDHYHPFSD
ncbi:MAG: hypothetical protein ACSNEK_01805 [Parachlamydiaceae bacterium]